MTGREVTLKPWDEAMPYGKVVELVARNAYAAWSSALANASRNPSRYERLANPQMGDLVLEVTRGVIVLVRDQWDEHGRALGWMRPAENPGDDCTLIALDGTVTNWSNSKFVAVLTPQLDAELRAAERAEMDARVAEMRAERERREAIR